MNKIIKYLYSIRNEKYKSIFVSSTKKNSIYNKIIGRINRLDVLESAVITVYQQIKKNRNDWWISGGMFWQTKNKIAYQAFFKDFYNPLYKKINIELQKLQVSSRSHVFTYSRQLVNEIESFVKGYTNFRKIHLENMIESLKKDDYKTIPKYENPNKIHLKPTKPIIKPGENPSPKKKVGFKEDNVLHFKKNKPVNNICKIKCNLQNKKGPFTLSERIKILECLKECM